VVLVVSGGHTELILMTGHGEYRRLGSTLDDCRPGGLRQGRAAAGLPYPGGPSIQKAAQGGDPLAFDFPRVMLRGDHGEQNFDFSFSGLKTAVLRLLQSMVPGYKPDGDIPADLPVADLAASFQAGCRRRAGR